MFDESNDNTNQITIPHAENNYGESAQEIEIMSEKTLIVRMYAVCVFNVFLLSSRQPIWILYATQLGDIKYGLIGMILLFGLVWKGLNGLLWGVISNNIGYDKSMRILLVVSVIAIFLECIASNFIILSIGFFLSQCGLTNIVLSCIAWLMPHNVAVKYTSYLYATIITAYLFGPVFAGVVSHFISYRMVFWINFVLALITLIYAFLAIPYNIQPKIEQKQLNISRKTVNQSNIVIEKSNTKWETINSVDESHETEKYDMESSHKDMNMCTNEINKDNMFPIYLSQNKQITSKTINLTRYEWIFLTLSILNSLWIPSVEIILGMYYCLYVIMHVKHGNMIHGSVQLLLMAIGSIIGKVTGPKLINISNSNKVIIEYMTLLLTSMLTGLMMLLYPITTDISMWYLYTFICGIFFGLFSMVTQVLILKFQPKTHTGYVNGICMFLKSISKAVGLLVIGVYWSKNENVMFYTISTMMFCGFVLVAVMATMHSILQMLHHI
eukprot:410495_1